jgi:hypothetical protein
MAVSELVDKAELAELSRDSSAEVREAVASNPNTSPFTLDFLSHDLSRGVRMSVIKNISTLSSSRKAAQDHNDSPWYE